MFNLKLDTERLHLLPFETTDLSVFHQLNIDPYIRKFLWDDESISQVVAKDILQQNQRHFREDLFGLWKMISKDKQDLIGYSGLWYFFEEPRPQLIYAILEKYAGQGFAMEGASAVLNYCKNQLKYSYLMAATDEEHFASQKLLLRLGFYLRETRKIDGKPTQFFRINFE